MNSRWEISSLEVLRKSNILIKERFIMKTLLRKCLKCSRYTLDDVCSVCGSQTGIPIPSKFSPEDKYGEYRRKLKKEQWNK